MKCYICGKTITGDSCKITLSLKFLGKNSPHLLREFNFRKVLDIKEIYDHLNGETMCGNCYMSIITPACKRGNKLREKYCESARQEVSTKKS